MSNSTNQTSTKNKNVVPIIIIRDYFSFLVL